MSNILIIAEYNGTTLSANTAKCVSCAQNFDGAEIHVAVLGGSTSDIAGQAAKLDGVSKVLRMDDSKLEHPIAAIWAPEIAKLAENYSHVFGPSSMFGKDLMPRVAALLGVNQVSDIMEVLGSHSFKRPIYANNAIITVNAPEDLTLVATVRTASYSAVGDDGSAGIESVSAQAEAPDHTRWVGLESHGGERPDLQTADVVVSGGRALASEDNFKIVYDFADSIGAAVGASRAAVDAGYVPNDMQVGQTGKIIAPDLYFAFGISGAIQHVTGIKDAGTIVAVNKDADAPIFELADIGLVGDLFEVIPQLQEKLGKAD